MKRMVNFLSALCNIYI